MITCIFENKNKTSLRHVVVDCLVIENGKILLVKRAAHLSNGGKYGLVGGYVNRNETIEEGVKREIKEETGYAVQIDYLMRIKDSPKRPKEDRQNVSFVYVVHPISRVDSHDDESEEIQWFDLDDIPSEGEFAFDHFEDIQEYIRRVKKG